METAKMVMNVLLGLVIFAAILYLAYISTKFIARRYSFSGKSSRNLKVLENLSIGKDSQLAVVKAGDKYLLLGITPQNVNYLKEIPPDEIEQQLEVQAQPMEFREALKKTFAESFGKKTHNKQEESDNDKNKVD